MRRNKTEWGIIALAMSGLAALVLYLLLAIWGFEKAKANAAPQPQVPTDYRPDISHCFHTDEERELWDCIRHVEVSDD